MAEDKSLNIHEVAKRLGVSEKTILRMISRGDIRAFKVAFQWRILESEVRRIQHISHS